MRPGYDYLDALLSKEGPEHFKACCGQMLEEVKRLLEAILAAKGRLTRAAILEPLNELHLRLGALRNAVSLMKSVHPDAAIRAAAEESEKDIARFSHGMGLNRELYEAVRGCDSPELDAIARRLVEHLVRDFRRAGVDRDEATREKVRALRAELVARGQEFLRNIVQDVRSIHLDGVEEMDGLPGDYVQSHKPGPGGHVTITTDYPDYNPFMTYAKSARRRRELYTAFRVRAYPANIDVLHKIIRTRHELATLLGYPSWAAYATEDKMIRKPQAVAEFIERVCASVSERAKLEYGMLLEEKRSTEPGAAEVFDWEKAHLEDRVRTNRFRVDSKRARAYLEYERVKAGVLSLTEELFGVKFVPARGALKWHEHVEVLDVVEDSRTVGRVYLDMPPRKGKYKHAAMYPLLRGVKGRTYPMAALVCNFPSPRGKDGPALLEHDDLVTFLHEFGHLIHQLLARDHEWAFFAGTSTEWDFIELPSQLYEEWAWDHEALRRFAVHHETGETIPRDLVDRLRKAKAFGRGLWVRHQMFYASVSLACYGPEAKSLDVSAVAREKQNRYSLFRFVQGTFFEASFGHLDDYSALYYSYMWSLMIEKEVFEAFRGAGAMDRGVARAYREKILGPGSSKDAADLVRDFLGRDFTFGPFETWLRET